MAATHPKGLVSVDHAPLTRRSWSSTMKPPRGSPALSPMADTCAQGVRGLDACRDGICSRAPYQQGAVAEAVGGVERRVAGGSYDVIRLQHLVQARGTGVGGHVQGCGPRQVSVFESAKWQVAASSVR